MKILGVDPGKTTGWALIQLDGKQLSIVDFGQTKDMTLIEIIDHIRQADHIVYEGFWVNPKMAMAGKFNFQEMPAIKVIGSLQTLASLHQKTLSKQTAAQRVPGFAWGGMTYKKGARGRHWQDAYAHATYYAVKELGALPVNGKRL